MKNYDLAIIGSGPGGYVAALYASRHNLSVCVIEKDLIGGTCLNRGCIPAKTILKSTAVLSEIKQSRSYGIEVQEPKLNLQKVMARKDEVVSRLRAGIEILFRANKIELIKTNAVIKGPGTVDAGGIEVRAKFIIIAAGSKVAALPRLKIDELNVLSSDGILNIQDTPKSLLIIGGGVIGCEFASLFNAIGVKVGIVELMDRLLPGQSRETSKRLEGIFKKRGIEVMTSSKVEAIVKDGVMRAKISNGKEVEAEKILVSVGRIADTENLGLDEAGIRREKLKICVDESLRSSIKGVYAIGDCVAGPQLAHKASYDGILACDNILGSSRHVDYSNIPNCIFTDPEIAGIGLNEDDAKAKYPDIKISKFPYLASGKACVLGKTEGFIKIIGRSDGTLVGVEIFGEGACDLIGEAVLAKTKGVNIKDWAYVVHGHPTLSEIYQEAAHIFSGTGIHSL